EVLAVASGRGEREARARVRGQERLVARAPIGDQKRGTGGALVPEVLVEFAAALIHAEEEAALGARLADVRLGDRLALEGELPPIAARRGDLVDLVGVAEAGRDQHAAGGIPVEEGGSARRLVLLR